MQSRKLTNIFFAGVLEDYKTYSAQLNQGETLEEFLDYLLDKEIISDHKIQHYAIRDLFEKKYEQNQQKKTQAIEEIAQIVKLSPRRIWSIIAQPQT